jgi:hypothetical protein
MQRIPDSFRARKPTPAAVWEKAVGTPPAGLAEKPWNTTVCGAAIHDDHEAGVVMLGPFASVNSIAPRFACGVVETVTAVPYVRGIVVPLASLQTSGVPLPASAVH